jgi:hypothetical protein
MASVVGCTVATTSHLAGARVVRDAWKRQHPDAPFWILLADVDEPERPTGGEAILTAREIGLEPAELRIRRGIYTTSEYATSLKPVLVDFLLREGADVVIFTDADTNLYAPLDALADAAFDAGVCLTPHVLSPLPADGRSHDDLDLLRLGVLNTGLVAVGRTGKGFVRWWVRRARRDCLGLPDDGFLLDQRWVDLAPTQLAARLALDPGLNVAFWNLHERDLQPAGDGWTVNGRPLRHFHFSGFAADDPATLTRHAMPLPHRVTLADCPAAAPLLRAYAQALIAHGHRQLRTCTYAFATTVAGRALAQRDRLLLREAVLAHEAGAAARPPDPFDPADQAAFAELVSTPASRLALSPQARARVTRANRLLPAGGHMGRRERLSSRAAALLMRHLGDPGGGLAIPSTSVLSEYH